MNLMNTIDYSRFLTMLLPMSSDLMLPDGATKLLEQENLTINQAEGETENLTAKHALRVSKYLSMMNLLMIMVRKSNMINNTIRLIMM